MESLLQFINIDPIDGDRIAGVNNTANKESIPLIKFNDGLIVFVDKG
jgi:hypothetical protein